MSRTHRDAKIWKLRHDEGYFDYYTEGEREKHLSLLGLWSYYAFRHVSRRYRTKPQRTNSHRQVRHHVKIICRTRQWNRLNRKDYHLYEWLD